jgi:prepilin-type N-terminal cleavage/methylation domain-containing protein
VPIMAHEHGSRGMTLVELMVAVAVTGIIMTLSVSLFFGQFKSYKRGQETKEIQETSNECLDLLKRDLTPAGWSVKPEMSFFFQDGGASGADQIFINDTTLINLNDANATRVQWAAALLTQGNGWGGCAEVKTGSGNSTITVSAVQFSTEFSTGVGCSTNQLDIDCDQNGTSDFKASATHYVISDLTGAGNKIAKILTINGNQLSLDRTISGKYVAPAVYYYLDTTQVLKRSDRSSGGAQPFAVNVVDLQVAYLDSNGNWYCNGSGACPMNPFDPRSITLIRVTLVTRSTDPIGPRNNQKYCQPSVENHAMAANTTCGYIYRTYSVTIQPRNANRS